MPGPLAALGLIADPSDDEVSINVDFSFPNPGFEYVLDLPVLGKFGAEFAANASFDYTLPDSTWEAAFGIGAEGTQGKRGRRPTLPLLTRTPKMKLYLGNKEIEGKLVGGARGTATIEQGIRFSEVFGRGEIEAKLELGRYGLPDLLGPGLSTAMAKIPGAKKLLDTVTIVVYVIPGINGEIVFALDPRFEFSRAELTGKVGIEAAYEPDLGKVKLRIYVGGEPGATFQIPPPLLKQLRFRAYAGVEAQAWVFKVDTEFVFVDVTYPKTAGTTVLSSEGGIRVCRIPVAGSRQWRLMDRPHLLAGSEGFALLPNGGASPTAAADSNTVDAFRRVGTQPVRGSVGFSLSVATLPAIGALAQATPMPLSLLQNSVYRAFVVPPSGGIPRKRGTTNAATWLADGLLQEAWVSFRLSEEDTG
jgi:hypothetical protein